MEIETSESNPAKYEEKKTSFFSSSINGSSPAEILESHAYGNFF